MIHTYIVYDLVDLGEMQLKLVGKRNDSGKSIRVSLLGELIRVQIKE